jgi:hypothetical protein
MRAGSSARGAAVMTGVLIASTVAVAKTAPSIERLVRPSAAPAMSAQLQCTTRCRRHLAGRSLYYGNELRILPTVKPLAAGGPASTEASDLRIAQRADPPLIIMPSSVTGNRGSVVALPIRIDSTLALHKDSVVRLWGVPPRFTLNAGNLVEQWWVVPLYKLPNLALNIPIDASGRLEIAVTLFDIDGTVLGNAKTMLVIQSTAPPPPTSAPGERAERNQLVVGRVQLSIEDKARAEQLLGQGEKYLADANIDVARQFFRRAADMGLAAAALKLATTYDPVELARMQVHGVVPDPNEALKWYERARQLGVNEADIRLAGSRAN